MSTNVTITLQSLYPYEDLATRSIDYRRSFEWQKPLLGLVTVIMLWITGSRGNLHPVLFGIIDVVAYILN